MELKIGLLRNVQLKSVEIIAQDHYFISASNSDLTKELKENSKLNIKSNQRQINSRSTK